jgi:hypothetical protein
MLDSKALNQITAANEASVEKQFNKLRYSVSRLDRNAKSPRPDFLISNRAGRPEMLCEVKTVYSAGYLPDRDAHISMLDEKLHDTGMFENRIDLTRISDNLANAVRKRNALVKTIRISPVCPCWSLSFLTSLLTISFVIHVVLIRK